MANEFVQTMANARIDAKSLSEFIFEPSDFVVQRRLAPTINTLNHYLDLFSKTAADGATAINQAIINSGFIIVDSFEIGATLTQRNQALRHTETGKLYRWAGDLPKAVPSNSTPNTSGGLGANAWLEVSDTTLRQELAEPYAAISLANSVVRVTSVQEFNNIPKKGKFAKAAYLVDSFWDGKNTGGGVFVWDATALKSGHDGIGVIDPDKVLELSSFGVYGNYFSPSTSGLGVFRRVGVKAEVFVEWAGVHTGIDDNSVALQAAISKYRGIKALPLQVYKHSSTLICTLENQYFLSEGGGLYTGGNFNFTGSGTQFKVMASVGYLSLKGISAHSKGIIDTDAYKTGTTAFDVSDGYVSVHTTECWISGFETLFKSDFKSFYNKFTRNRFDNFKEGLLNFANYNLTIRDNRVQVFHNFLKFNGESFPLILDGNSFERFNGAIASAVAGGKNNLTFTNNYVEIYPTVTMPTNFPRSVGALPDNFGNNSLFTGEYGTLTINDSHLDLAGVFRLCLLESCDFLTIKRNKLTDYLTGSYLTRLVTCNTTLEAVDIINAKMHKTGAGQGNAVYAPMNLGVSTPYGFINQVDPVTGLNVYEANKRFRLSIVNGWTENSDYGGVMATRTAHGVVLSGVISGAAKTSDVITTLNSDVRPASLGVTKKYAILSTTTGLSSGDKIGLKYNYDTGELSLVGTPTLLTGISLDGLVIPNRAN